MTVRESLSTIAFLFSLMAILSLVELAIPLFARDERSKGRGVANLGLTVLTFLLNWGLHLAAVAIAFVLSIQGRGWLQPLALSLPTLIVISVVTLDLCSYLAHLTMHKIPLLWRVHSVHHNDPFLDVTTSFRQHPIEGVWRFLWIIIPVWALGLPVSGLVVYRLLSAVTGLFEHANIRLGQPLDRVLSLVWTTPNMHKVHHSRAPQQTDSNYGNILTLFDRGFRTFTPSEQASSVVYGLEDSDPQREKSFLGLMTMPFAQSRHEES